jgi:hypothetical protein
MSVKSLTNKNVPQVKITMLRILIKVELYSSYTVSMNIKNGYRHGGQTAQTARSYFNTLTKRPRLISPAISKHIKLTTINFQALVSGDS